jgi:Rrf2 family transcriptional regulator, iron-sulfur cluster assembly transcription factor
MIYSTGCEYGIRALMNMAREAPNGGLLLLRRIVGGDDLPSHFVGKILQILVRKGILISAKGRGGGFALSRPPEKITLRQIVEALDGTQRINRCILGFSPCDSSQHCPQHDEWVEVRQQIERMLDHTTLTDLVRAQDRKRIRSMRTGPRRK